MAWWRKKWHWPFSQHVSIYSDVSDDVIVVRIWGEKITGKGEDAEPLFAGGNGAYLLGVFDGLGGAGSTLYDVQGVPRTGAYIASRLARNTVHKYLLPRIQGTYTPKEDLIVSLKATLISEFRRKAKIASSQHPTTRLKTKLVRTLPTTLALLWTSNENSQFISIHTAWAGDSRCYVLTPESGLQLLTVDDVKLGNDYGDVFSQDAPLLNYINADVDFYINYYSLHLKKPLVLITATDGCFGYVPTPAHFEYLLVQTLQEASNEVEWKEMLLARFEQISGDDISMVLMGVGWRDFTAMKHSFSSRMAGLASRYGLSELERLEIILAHAEKRLREIENLRSRWLNEKENIRVQVDEKYDELWNRYKLTYNLLKVTNNGQTYER